MVRLSGKQTLSELLKGIILETGTLEGTGYRPEDLDQLLADINSAGLGNAPKTDVEEVLVEAFLDAAPPPPEAPELQEVLITAPGETWILGEHPVTCDDAPALKDVDRLLAGEAVDLVFTDPPYNVDYEGYRHRRAPSRVTDQGLRSVTTPATASTPNGAACCVCGCQSRWMDPFSPRGSWRRHRSRRRRGGGRSKNYVFT